MSDVITPTETVQVTLEPEPAPLKATVGADVKPLEDPKLILVMTSRTTFAVKPELVPLQPAKTTGKVPEYPELALLMPI